MKKPLFAAAMLSALVGCSVPMTSYAASFTVVNEGEGYVVLSGQGEADLQQTIEEICEAIKNGVVCPETPTLPDSSEGETPTLPDASETETPVQPDAPEDDAPALPDSSVTETPVQPDAPETDNDTADESSVHPYINEVLRLVNEERAKAGLSELKLDAAVTAAANVRAKEIKQSFSHTRPDGSSFSTALTEQGAAYRGSGENIAWGQKTPEQVMNAWMNSDGHRANILNKSFTNLGVGYYLDESGTAHWVQLFTY